MFDLFRRHPAAVDRLAARRDARDHAEAGGDAGGAVVERPRQRAFEHGRVEFVGLAVGIDVGARETRREQGHAERRCGAKQLVDEGVLGPAQGRERHRRLGQEFGGIVRAAVRRGDHHRHGLVRRQAAVQS